MKLNLTRLATLAVFCLLFAAVGMAAPACGTTAGTTPQTALLSPLYVTAGGNTYTPPPGYTCDIGNLQFSNFEYSSSVPPADVSAVPETTPGNQGLKFTGPFGVSDGGVEDVDIAFTVTALSGSIDDIGIDILGANTQGAGSSISYIEQFCTVTTANPVCSLFTDTPTGPLSASINLSQTSLGGPVTSLSITKDVTLIAGANGSAVISSFDNNYSNTVPEPRAVSVLLSLGLFAAVLFFKKRSQAVRS